MSTSQAFALPSTPSHHSNLPRSSSFRDALSAPKTVRWSQEEDTVSKAVVVAPSFSASSTTTPTSLVRGAATTVSTPIRRALPASTSTAASSSSKSMTSSKATDEATFAQAPLSAAAAGPTSSMTAPRASASSLRNRIKWNAGALLAIFALPRLNISKRVYWSLLDVIYATLGGRSDQTVDAATAWLKWALFIIFLINLLEASAMLNMPQMKSHSPPTRPAGLTSRPSFDSRSASITALSSTKATAPMAVRSRVPSEVRYSPHSPLKASLEAAKRSASGGKHNFSSSPAYSSPLNSSGLGNSSSTPGGSIGTIVTGRRLPSGPPASGASPLAAYLARRGTSSQQSRSSSTSDFDAVGDVSSDSIEVDRALRALSNNYMRSTSAAASVSAQTMGSDSR